MSEEYVAAEAVEAPAAPATTEVVAETPAVEEQAEKPEQKPERVFTQRELDKIIHARLTKAENAWERRNREMVETVLRNQPANTQREQAAQVPEGAPDPMKYQNYSDYVRDMARYEARQEQEKFFSSMQAQREQVDLAQPLVVMAVQAHHLQFLVHQLIILAVVVDLDITVQVQLLVVLVVLEAEVLDRVHMA